MKNLKMIWKECHKFIRKVIFEKNDFFNNFLEKSSLLKSTIMPIVFGIILSFVISEYSS